MFILFSGKKLKMFRFLVSYHNYSLPMVIVRNFPYPVESEECFKDAFEKYKQFKLSSFQKHAIEAIVSDCHVLVTAHTGSGKTLPAEFAIEHWVGKGKKVIYTSPIKALSNQKFYEFSKKYPHISFGLFTGDIKTNPEADVLIMTTEILMNRLFNHNKKDANMLQFQMDFENELAAVIFDEVHYINDAERGQVWEKTILMLPDHVQMIMLSATMDNPEIFANWIEENHKTKKVFVCPTTHREVPLSHFGYMAVGEHEFKQIKDKATQEVMRKLANKPVGLKDSGGKFNVEGYNDIIKIQKQAAVYNWRISRHFVVNNLVQYLRKKDMLPAIFFVFSRKNVESCAKELTVPILEEGSITPYIIEKEAKDILRRLPNYEEYIHLPEFVELISLMGKGIGIHHSGMIPILREIVELFISKKYIQVLFATESFAIGLDCPIKTTVFTGIHKFDGNNDRFLESHEYTQMAGRAGRRGIDTVGYVIHCNNLFRNQPTQTEYKLLMGGNPPRLESKFKINYSLVLNILKSSQTIESVVEFIERSMMHKELQLLIHSVELEREEAKAQYEKSLNCHRRTPVDICLQYNALVQSESIASQSKKKKILAREMDNLKEEYPNLLNDAGSFVLLEKKKTDILKKETRIGQLKNYVYEQVVRVCSLLKLHGFLMIYDSNILTPTINGYICSHVAEVHGPIWVYSMVTSWNYFENFSAKQLVGLFSCATDVKVNDEFETSVPDTKDLFLKERLLEMKKLHNTFAKDEDRLEINTGIRYDDIFSFSIVEESMNWCDCKTEEDCKLFIQENLHKKGIALGDFTKAILKIANIAKELRSLYELEYCNTQTGWLHKLTTIEELVLKYMATNQSLYV